MTLTKTGHGSHIAFLAALPSMTGLKVIQILGAPRWEWLKQLKEVPSVTVVTLSDDEGLSFMAAFSNCRTLHVMLAHSPYSFHRLAEAVGSACPHLEILNFESGPRNPSEWQQGELSCFPKNSV